MAREAVARLYDVEANSVVMKRLTHTGKYDTGSITFRAKKEELLDLDKLHESVWATRLSGGTSSGLVSLEVTAIGKVIVTEKETLLQIEGYTDPFVLAEDSSTKPAEGKLTPFAELRKAVDAGAKTISVTGRLDGWSGKWPQVLKQLPPKPRKLLITEFKTQAEN